MFHPSLPSLTKRKGGKKWGSKQRGQGPEMWGLEGPEEVQSKPQEHTTLNLKDFFKKVLGRGWGGFSSRVC